MRRLDSLTPAELREAALAVVRDEGDIEGWLVADRVARQLGGSLNDAESLAVRSMNYYHEAEAAKTRFAGRVRRVLDKLAGENLIVKIGANRTLPSGRSGGRFAHYYTPEAFGAARHAAAEAEQARIEQHNRWNAINQRLLAQTGATLNDRHRLSADEWERLLDRAGW